MIIFGGIPRTPFSTWMVPIFSGEGQRILIEGEGILVILGGLYFSSLLDKG